jgi:hypothetical protein
MTEDGFVTLAENLIRTLDNPATLFAGEKRSREESVEGVVVGGWRRKTHEWLYSTVSGTGARRDNRVQQMGGRCRSACPAWFPGTVRPEDLPVEGTWVLEEQNGPTSTRVRLVPFILLKYKE